MPRRNLHLTLAQLNPLDHRQYINQYIVGTSRNDVLVGAWGNDTIIGNGRNDFIFGEDGNDTIYGDKGPGRHVKHVIAGNDIIKAGKGDDHIYTGDGVRNTRIRRRRQRYDCWRHRPRLT